MNKQRNNKGFSLVELIIVIAIMAVLIGMLAPIYTQYVERTKRTTDCNNLGTVLDACEVLAADPNIKWTAGTTGQVTLTIDTNQTGHLTSYVGGGPVTELKELAPVEDVFLTANWGPFVIEVERDAEGHISFDMVDDDHINELAVYSTELSNRLE